MLFMRYDFRAKGGAERPSQLDVQIIQWCFLHCSPSSRWFTGLPYHGLCDKVLYCCFCGIYRYAWCDYTVRSSMGFSVLVPRNCSIWPHFRKWSVHAVFAVLWRILSRSPAASSEQECAWIEASDRDIFLRLTGDGNSSTTKDDRGTHMKQW